MKRRLFVGADEVGRGAFAGPVVAGAVILPPEIEIAWNENKNSLPVVIRDSKKMTPRQREISAEWIKENAIGYALGEASANQINEIGINSALQYAFKLAINKIVLGKELSIDKLLVDALFIKDIDGFPASKQKAIIRGDSISCHIAAASIVAKVYRDELMQNLAKEENYFVYQWQQNKGYGTKAHREAIKKYGICPYHRTLFVRKTI